RAGVPRLLTGWVPDGTAIALVLAALGTAFTQMAAAETQIALDFRKYFATLVGSAAVRLAGLVAGLIAAADRSVQTALVGLSAGSFLAGGALGWSALGSPRRGSHVSLQSLRSTGKALGSFGLPILGSTFVVAAIEYVDVLII